MPSLHLLLDTALNFFAKCTSLKITIHNDWQTNEEVFRFKTIRNLSVHASALACLSYGCGGGSTNFVFIEGNTKYVGANADNQGKIFFTSQSDPLITIEAKEDGTLPENSSLTLKNVSLKPVK